MTINTGDVIYRRHFAAFFINANREPLNIDNSGFT